MSEIVYVAYCGCLYTKCIEIIGVFDELQDAESHLLMYLAKQNSIFNHLTNTDEYDGPRYHRWLYTTDIHNGALNNIFVDNESIKKFQKIVRSSEKEFPYHLIKSDFHNFNYLSLYDTGDDKRYLVYNIDKVEHHHPFGCNIKGENY